MLKKVVFVILFMIYNIAGSQTINQGKQIKIIVPFQSGGPTDILAREIAGSLQTKLNQSVIVENKPGAGALVGINYVLQNPADGMSLLLATPTIIANQFFLKDITYDIHKDLKPVVLIAKIPEALVVSNKSNINSINELITFAKNNPNKLNYGTSGVGSVPHLDAVLLSKLANIEMTHVPYKGFPPILIDLANGLIDLSFISLVNAIQNEKSNRIKILGITANKRSKTAPDIPTLDELGVKGYDLTSWFGIAVKNQTSDLIVQNYNILINEVLQEDNLRQRINLLGGELVGGPPIEFQNLISKDLIKLQQIFSK